MFRQLVKTFLSAMIWQFGREMAHEIIEEKRREQEEEEERRAQSTVSPMPTSWRGFDDTSFRKFVNASPAERAKMLEGGDRPKNKRRGRRR